MKYVLDTNVVSAFMRAEPRVLAAVKHKQREQLLLCEPVAAEIAYGIHRLPPSKHRDKLRVEFDALRPQLGVAPWTPEVSERFGELKAVLERRGERLEDLDIAIGVHALVVGATLVTVNTKHMSRIPGLMLEDWTLP
jgi:tRNA(fMet)-specific endonuclease VapC